MDDKIIGHSIERVIYSEVNHHEGKFDFEGFDTFDHAINVQMINGFCWNLGWKDEEYFELGEGHFERNQHLNANEVKSWDATARWNEYLDSKVSNFKVTYIDEAEFIPCKVKIGFENGRQLTVLIAEELNSDGSIPCPLDYEFGGEIYVFHDENLLKTNN